MNYITGMEAKRILVTGAAGFLGWNLVRDFAEAGCAVTGSYGRSEPDRRLSAYWMHLPIDPPRFSPASFPEFDVMVHCAAVSNVARCNENRKQAYATNVYATRGLAEICSRRSAPFVFISTDLVFDGNRGWYTETDTISPTSWYAETKCEAESLLTNFFDDVYIIRTALMYGKHRGTYGSFTAWTVEALRQGTPLHLFTNQFRTPLYVRDVSRLIAGLLARTAPYGIYHAAGSDRLSRHDMGIAIAESLGLQTAFVHPSLLQREVPLLPTDDTSLITRKAEKEAGMLFTPWLQGLALMNNE
jgi:dTDP-4-dehydrorhamnose reductase